MKSFMLVVAAGLVIGMFGCEKKAPPPPAKPTAQGPTVPAIPGVSPEATKSATQAMGDARDKAISSLQDGLETAQTKLDALVAKAKEVAADKKPEMDKAIDQLRADMSNARTKLSALKDSAATGWEKLSLDVRSSLETLDKKLSDAAAKYK